MREGEDRDVEGSQEGKEQLGLALKTPRRADSASMRPPRKVDGESEMQNVGHCPA
jgi:hypothetical protein